MNRRLLSLLACLSLLTIAAGSAVADTIIVGKEARTYQLVRPAAGARAPLVLVLHGNGGSGREVAHYTGWDKLAVAEGFAAVFPDAIDGAWQFSTAVVGSPSNPDLRFLNKLISTLVADGTADPRRIYMTGLSRGGAMTYAMVCGKAQLFAAAAPIITGAVADLKRICRPYKPVPLLFMNGTADKLIPYNGGLGSGPTADVNLMAVDDFVGFWRTANGCAAGNAGETALPDLDPGDKSIVKLVTSSCPRDREVTLYKIVGGGHQQPRRPAAGGGNAVEPKLGPQNHDIDGATEIWHFFRGYAL